jgi:hypothetical protein
MSRVNEKYRQHTIVVDRRGGVVKGRIWKDEGTEKIIVHDTEGSDIANTVAYLKKFVDEKLETDARMAGSTPDEARVLRGLMEIQEQLHDGQRAMLKAHYHAEGQEITATELANAAGYSNYSSANLHYGLIGRLLYELVPIDLEKYADGSPIYTFYLAEATEKPETEANWKWKLRPEVSKAIEALGLDA